MIRKLMSAAMVLGLVQLGCASVDAAPECATPKAPAAVKHECKKGKNGKCDHKAGAKHECKKGKKGQCSHKAGAKHQCKKAQAAATK